MHGLVGVELVVLGRDDDGMDPDRTVVCTVIFNGILGLGIRTEVGHEDGFPPQVGQSLERQVRQGEGKGHVLPGVAAGIAEHHALVAGTLGFGLLADHAPVDVLALVMDGGQDAAGIAVKAVFSLVVTDAVDDPADGFLDIDVCVLGTDFAAHDDQAGGAEGFAGHFGIGVLTEELVEDGIGDLVGHFVRMAFGNGFGSKQIIHVNAI